MFPHYQDGDFVAGTKHSVENLKSLLGLDCIIQTKAGLMTVRRLQQPSSESFNLIATNLQAKAKDLIFYDKELVTAAPIVWHRRYEPR